MAGGADRRGVGSGVRAGRRAAPGTGRRLARVLSRRSFRRRLWAIGVVRFERRQYRRARCERHPGRRAGRIQFPDRALGLGAAGERFRIEPRRQPHRRAGFGPVPQPDRGSIDLLGTLTGRLGYAWGPLLLYGQGGVVWAHTRYDLSGFFAPGLEFAVSDDTKWGWTAGAGAEYQIAPTWSGFLEYDYLGFGADAANLKCTAVPNCGPPGANAIAISIRENFHVIKTGVNFRF